MEQTIYVDILLVVNLFINYLLLRLTAKLVMPSAKKGRIFAGAMTGALFSLSIFLPGMPVFANVFIRAAMALIISAIAFGFRNKRLFFKCAGAFVFCTFLFAGAMTAYFMLFAPKGMLVSNSFVYFNISAPLLIVSAVIIYFILGAAQHLLKRGRIDNTRYQVEVGCYGRSAILEGLLDTGCDLSEMFTGIPVCVCEFSALEGLIPETLRDVIKSSFSNMEKVAKSAYGKDLRLIPYKNLGGTGLMCAVRPEKFTLMQGGKRFYTNKVYLAFSGENFSDGDYTCLINPKILEYISEEKREKPNAKHTRLSGKT
ncbi:MAG: sigma-E processing peptidase SpoIIGA [Oscillospiraceae bacterium]|nr:sigma-E processing peptidase SpoIIGA [Oscillospiraceae bacterium]